MNLLDSTVDPMQWVKITTTYDCGYKNGEQYVCCPIEKKPETNLSAPDLNAPIDVLKHQNFKLLNEDCGILATTRRIIRGNKTGIFDYPWMARLLYNTSKSNISLFLQFFKFLIYFRLWSKIQMWWNNYQ